MSRNLGLTKTQAHSMQNRGYKHHALMPINRARPSLQGVDYVATPIREEGHMLYSFANPQDYTQFVADYGAEHLPV